MIYTIYFNLKDSSDDQKILSLTNEFTENLVDQGLITKIQFERFTDKTKFKEMPEFKLAVFFNSEKHMINTFDTVRKSLINKYPHKELMELVSDFKVTFSNKL